MGNPSLRELVTGGSYIICWWINDLSITTLAHYNYGYVLVQAGWFAQLWSITKKVMDLAGCLHF